MRILLVHGWAFDASVWDEVAARLPEHELARVELGFLGATPDVPPIDLQTLCVGHSLGALWLLRQTGGRMLGFMSINGFDHFGDQALALRAMRARLRRDAAGQVSAFRDAAGVATGAAGSFNEECLREGLDWLAEWDERAAHKRLRRPVVALASRDDRIAPPALTQACWRGERLLWSESGGHVLPLTRPGWCADHIRSFADELRAE